MSESLLPNSAIRYRADIDGLRAVAVLLVVAFHVGLLRLGGGYVGVDVFFVISGYLISSIMFSEIAASRFSVVVFYERRIRRIFPALFAMLIVVGAFAAIFYLPTELVEFGRTSMAAAASVSNIYLWKQSGYFAQQNSNILLHTWSLAVEEQFYIMFPLFLVMVRRFSPSHLKLAVFVVFLASLACSAVMVLHSPNTAFYMPYTRAWELLMGTIVSLKILPPLQSPVMRNLATLTGLGMILYSGYFYSDATLFPGLSALTPCLGAALIIGAGESGGSFVASCLSWRPIVFIGLISYSLYLWHWAVLMVYRMGILSDISAQLERFNGALFPPGRLDHVVEILISFAFAILSWRFIELPFRKGPLRLAGRPLFASAGAVVALCFAFSFWAIFSGGGKGRFSSNTLRIASYLDKSEQQQEGIAQRRGTCFLDASLGQQNFNLTSCLRQDPSKKNYLLIGDSHAAALWPALSAELPGVNVMQVNVTSCKPILRQERPGLCSKVMDYVFQTYLSTSKVHTLILEAQWDAASLRGLDETLSWARQRQFQVVVIGNVPEYDASLARLLAYSIAWNQPNLPTQHRLTGVASMEKDLRSIVVDRWHFPFVSLYDQICQAGTCLEYADAQKTIPLMDDSNHLNRFGALLAVRRIVDSGELQ